MRPSARAKLRAPEISLIKICKFRGAGGRRVSIANVVGATVSRWGTVIETQLSICTRITTQRYSRFAAKVVIANGTPRGWRRATATGPATRAGLSIGGLGSDL